MTNIPRAQEIYRHFKGNVYQIVTIAEHTETEEKLVVYQAMYGDFKIYARPLGMFLEKVDRTKYPEATQEYRFEKLETSQSIEVAKPVGTSQSIEVTKPVEASQEQAESQLDPLLLEFLDADTYEQQLNILVALHHRITDEMITTMAIASDVEVKEGDLETRYTELKNCLLTLEKYETARLR